MKNPFIVLAFSIFFISLFNKCTLPESDYTNTLNDAYQLFDSLTQASIENGDTQTLNNALDVLSKMEEIGLDSAQTKKAKKFNVENAREQIIAKLAILEKERADALSKLRTYDDEFNNEIYYSDKSSPRYTNRNGFFLNFAISRDGKTIYNPNLKIRYYADNWLFIERITFLVDGQKLEYTAGNMERDNDGGKIWEFTSKPVDAIDKVLIDAIIESKTSKMRLHGKQYYEDKTISSQQKKALKNVRDAYILAGGNW